MKKFKVFFTTAIIVIVFCSAAYARIIPGWDRPFDPDNYYSQTNISWADSNNPSFFYRDLGWNGGTVIDNSREVQSAIYTQQIFTWLGIKNSQLAIAIANMIGLNNLPKQQQSIAAIQNSAADLNKSHIAAELWDSSDEKSIREQAILSETAYKNLIEASNNLNNNTEDDKALSNIIENAASGESLKQLEQDNVLVDGMMQAEMAKRNALLSNLAAARAVAQKTKDKELKGYYDSIDKAKLKVRNPYQNDDRDTINGYVKSEAKGFVSFK